MRSSLNYGLLLGTPKKGGTLIQKTRKGRFKEYPWSGYVIQTSRILGLDSRMTGLGFCWL